MILKEITMKKRCLLLSVLLILSVSASALAAFPDQLQGYLAKQRPWEYIQFGR